MPKISVIVPVYNVEAYLDRCIQSILNQTFTDFELILVDDGSPDNCPSMCDAWAEKDNRIVVFHKENGGVSSARNCGIEKAMSELICFVDSDDYCDTCMLEKMISKYEEGFDFVFCSFMKNKYKETKLIKSTEAVYDFTDGVTMSDMPQNFFVNGLFHSCWGKIYIKDVIITNELRFNTDMKLSEDSYFNLSYFEYINSWVFVNEPLYSYCSNDYSSATNMIYVKACRWYLNVGEKLTSYINTIYNKHKAEDTIIKTMFPQFYGSILKMCSDKDKSIRKELNQVVKNDFLKYIIKTYNKNFYEKIIVFFILKKSWFLVKFINKIYVNYSYYKDKKR